MAYVVAPLAGWLMAGSLKFVVNSMRSRRLAWDLIGYGGMPSTHTAIVTTTTFLVGLKEGWATPVFSLAATLGFIVVIDALSLRRQIGAHAAALNLLRRGEPAYIPLRERLGHHRLEVLGGAMVGFVAALLLSFL
ncbi:MAG: divergent PAP2 family protein [Gemmatimonadetes bacterium]|nr:divergent PAP2 family protein [Gemmatimonadota bacterium]